MQFAKKQEYSICPEGYPECIDPEVLKITDTGLDPAEDEVIVTDDYRVDKTGGDCTYFMPDYFTGVEPPTRRSVRLGQEILTADYYDDNPKNAWIYERPKGPFMTLVNKYEWGGKYPKSKRPVNFPLTTVRFHQTGTESIEFPECIGIVQEIQKKYLNDGRFDMPYNFLIGKDGQVYEGTGWYVDAEKSTDAKQLKGKCLEIAYIGTFKGEDPSWDMVKAGLDIIRFGLETSFISSSYSIQHKYDIDTQ